MLKLSILSLLILLSLQLKAQNVSFLNPSNIWIERRDTGGYHGFGSHTIDTLSFEKDTIIESITYKKMFNTQSHIHLNGNVNKPDTILTKNTTYGYFREDKAQLYFRNTPQTKEMLLYDMDKYKVGDTLKFMINDSMRTAIGQSYYSKDFYITIDSINKIKLADSIERKMIHYRYPFSYSGCFKGWIIEGIGSNGGIIPSITSTYSSGSIFKTLNKFSSNGLKIIDVDCGNLVSNIAVLDEKSIKIYPNPAHDYIRIEKEDWIDNISRINIINPLGQVIQAVQNSSILNNPIIEIPLRNLNSGLYFIQLITDKNQIILKKVVVEN